MDALWALLFVGIIAGSGLLTYVAWRRTHAGRIQGNMKGVASTVRDAQEGALVSVIGRVTPPEHPVFAPLSKRPCAFWQVRVMHVHGEVEEDKGFDHAPGGFAIEDATGSARVVTQHVESLLREDFHTNPDPDATEDAAYALLRRLHIDYHKRLVLLESILTPGTLVEVCGVARREQDASSGDAGLRDNPMRLVLDAPDDAPLYVRVR
jgi:hypothetical protein